MTIKTEPFLSGKWGWDEGESGWKEGVDENFLKFSYMLNKNVDGFVGTLPASPSNGTAYFLTTDNTLNARVDGLWYKYPVPKGFVVTEKVSGVKYEFNGSVFIATVSAVDKVKLDGIASGATVNSSDASLRDRATHTGTQATSTVTGLDAALVAKAPLASPTFTGTVSAPTPSTADNTTKVATTAFVKAQGYLTSASAGLVTSVASRTGDVVLAKADVGLPNVDNTADTSKPVSTAQQTALNLKANLDSPVFTTATTLPSATTIGSVSAAEISTLVGVSSGIQSQLNGKAASSHTHSDATTSVSGSMSGADKTKLNGIATGATVNSSDATLLSRSNHTGTQTSGTISDFGEAVQDVVGSIVVGTGNITATYNDGVGTHTISTTATVNSSDAALLARSNHTGTQAVGTITGLGSLATLSTAPIANGGTGATDAGTARSNLGLGNVDNTSDLSKPVSTATQTALNGKQAAIGYTPANRAGDTFTGSVSVQGQLLSTGDQFVGIGTGQRLLHIDGGGSGASAGGAIYFKNAGDTTAAIGHTSAIIGGTYNTYLDLYSTGGIYFHTSGTSNVSISPSGVLTATNGSGINQLSADNVSMGTLSPARLPFSYSTANNVGSLVQRDASGHIYTNTAYSTYVNSSTGGVFGGLVSIKAAIELGEYGVAGSPFIDFNSGGTGADFDTRIVATGGTGVSGGGQLTIQCGNLTTTNSITASGGFYGSGANLNNLSYSQLPWAPVQQGGGIGQLNNKVYIGWTSGSKLKATIDSTDLGAIALESWASNANNLSSGTVADARLSSNVALVSTTVTKATPAQLFQSLGTVNGSVTVNGSNGTHVLATVNGNTTWTFPTPSATEALALTLELTNGGAYTMTWPSGTRWAGGVAPTLTASGTDILVFTKAGTNNWRGYLSSKDNK